MKYMMVLAFFVLSLIGCSKGGGGGSQASTQSFNKSLFSKWEAYNGSWSVDFTGSDFGVNPFNIDVENGPTCSCTLYAYGTQSSGTYQIASCSSDSGTSSDDSICVQFESSGSYIKTNTSLNVCENGSGCNLYH